MDIPKKPGIYLSNGKYYQTKNLYKKAKKLHDFQVVEISDSDDCADLDNMLKKYNQQPSKQDYQEGKKIILHHYRNNDTGYSITSIYDNLQEEGYVQID